MASQLYLVEDHDLMRSSMTAYLNSEDNLTVVGVAEDGEEALEALTSGTLQPDLVVIDIALPGMSGIDLLRRLREHDNTAVCLMLSGHAEEAYVESAKAAGAHGYVMKGQPDEYLRAVHTILDGEIYRSDTVAAMWDRAPEPS